MFVEGDASEFSTAAARLGAAQLKAAKSVISPAVSNKEVIRFLCLEEKRRWVGCKAAWVLLGWADSTLFTITRIIVTSAKNQKNERAA
jgi:hypothetical protein